MGLGPVWVLGFFIMCDFENSIHKNGKNSVKYQGKINELIYYKVGVKKIQFYQEIFYFSEKNL